MTFFTNKSDEIRLQNFLKTEFQKLSQSYLRKELIYSVQRNCEDLKKGLNIPTYECHHQEVDTILLFIVPTVRKTGYDDTITIDAEVTDIIALSSFVANKENRLLGKRRKKSTYNCLKLCSP